jgi:hypothetical protein
MEDMMKRTFMMKRTLMLFLTAGLIGSGIGMTVVGAKERKPPPEVRAIGEATNCVNIRSIQSTNVVDNQTIDFTMVGGKIMRNVLPYSCPSLKFNDSFSYRTSLSQLCSVDIIRVLQSNGGYLREGAACGLGKFQQVEVVKKTG